MRIKAHQNCHKLDFKIQRASKLVIRRKTQFWKFAPETMLFPGLDYPKSIRASSLIFYKRQMTQNDCKTGPLSPIFINRFIYFYIVFWKKFWVTLPKERKNPLNQEICHAAINSEHRQLGCRIKAKHPLMGPRPVGECPPWRSF